MSNPTANSDLERAEHLGYGESKGVKRVSIFNDGVQVNSATSLGNSTYGKNRINPAAGLGFDYHINSRVFIRAEWKYVFGPNVSLGGNNQKVRLAKSAATLGVGTNFSF